MSNFLTMILGTLNLGPGLKTKLAAVAALVLAIIAAWNGSAPGLGVDVVIPVPDWVNAFVLALLGVGAANQPVNKK